jgi:hypothetical protein
MWRNWNTGNTDWKLGHLIPDEILYYLNGPAIFVTEIGLSKFLFFKSDEFDLGDYYIASVVTDREINALKEEAFSAWCSQSVLRLVAAN